MTLTPAPHARRFSTHLTVGRRKAVDDWKVEIRVLRTVVVDDCAAIVHQLTYVTVDPADADRLRPRRPLQPLTAALGATPHLEPRVMPVNGGATR